ncbi:MFS transporter [Phenylobacterium sp.]|uniref:MFS transporter n=1 Tax=Phenylobacterium sp. TaxID=1871053 RepID=UPI0035B032F7
MSFYALGSMSNGIKNRSLSAFLLLFYNQVLGLPAPLVGAIIMVLLAIDGLLDPIVGVASDNARTCLGRRHPFMYASAIPYGVCFALIWNPPRDAAPAVLAVWLILTLFGTRVFDTFFEVPSSALGPELVEDYDRRTTLITVRYFFTFLGGVILTFIAYRVFLRDGPAASDGLFSRAGYGHYGLLAGLVIATVILVATRSTHHRIPWLRDPPPRTASPLQLFRETLSTLATRSFWVVTASGTFAATAGGVLAGLSTYFHVYFWELGPKQLSYLVTAGFAASLGALVVAPALFSRVGKRNGAIILFIAAFAVDAVPVALRLLDLLPENGSAPILWILIGEALLSGAIGLMLNIAFSSMVADLTEDAEIRTGLRSEGLLISADNFLKKATSGLGVFISSVVLTLVGFPEKARPGQVPEAALRELGQFFIVALGAIYLVAILCLLAFPIDRNAHQRNLETLKRSGTDPRDSAEGVST